VSDPFFAAGEHSVAHALRALATHTRSKKQFAEIDTGFLGWDFQVRGEDGRALAAVNRNFAGFAREIFTDTGSYALYMDALHGPEAEQGHALSRDERAVLLSCAICIDMDYFSRHSRSGGLLGDGMGMGMGGMFPMWGGGGGSGDGGEGGAAPSAQEADVAELEEGHSWGGLFGGEDGGSSSPWGSGDDGGSDSDW
jgi:hypothetical protein